MRNRWGKGPSWLWATALAAALSASSARAVNDLSLVVDPASQTAMPGGTVTVRLDVANLSQAINGVQVLLRYDPTRLSLLNIVPTDLGFAPPNAGWVEVSRNDVAGDVTYAASINGGQIAINHTIAVLTFQAIAEGVTTVLFRANAPPLLTKLSLASTNATVLPNTLGSGSITLSCDDGLFCNGAETFDGFVCQPGVNPCNDGVLCTVDSCDELLNTCSNIPSNLNCDDGLFCNGAETCDAVLDCQPGLNPCDDGVLCTDDTCDELLDTCSNVANDANCADGLFCNGVETCDAVLDCQPGLNPCDDGVLCTDDLCDEVINACSNLANDANCNDGLFCNGAETCDALLGCQLGLDPCQDNIPCTIDTCDELLDVCSNAPDNTVCGDGVFCNGTETCDALLGCQVGVDPCAPLICDEVGLRCLAPLRISNLEVYYPGRFADAPDTGKQFLAVGMTATLANVSNYWLGITGVRVFFDQPVLFQTTPAAAFLFEWTTGTGSTFSAATGAATNVTVTAVDQPSGTVVSIVLVDNFVRRRWLKVTLDAAQVTTNGVALDGELVGSPIALPSGDGIPGGNAVFALGNMPGDASGDLRALLADIGQIRAAVNPFLAVPITNPLDVDKDGKVLLTDVGRARLDVNPFFTLPLNTP